MQATVKQYNFRDPINEFGFLTGYNVKHWSVLSKKYHLFYVLDNCGCFVHKLLVVVVEVRVGVVKTDQTVRRPLEQDNLLVTEGECHVFDWGEEV